MTAARKLNEMPLAHESESEINLQARTQKVRRRRFPATLKICFLAALFVGLCVLYLGQQLTFSELSGQLAKLEEEVKVLEQRNDYLLLTLETERSLQKIEYLARAQLGMVDPDSSTSVVMNSTTAPAAVNGRWVDDGRNAEGQKGVFAALANWLNKAFPLGGVEAGTLQR